MPRGYLGHGEAFAWREQPCATAAILCFGQTLFLGRSGGSASGRLTLFGLFSRRGQRSACSMARTGG